MKFTADLHVHSRFSRATARDLDLENLYISSQLKGITLVATGDFTHPAWFAEIQDKLIPAEPGLFKLKEDIARECDKHVPHLCRRDVRFILETEISSIYKKNGKTRKNHNLIYMPNMETASRFNAILDGIGNIKSDGRPILGLDAKKLLEIMLDCSSDAFFIPAHIWTPWFSLLGSKSGFDSIEECFEDLSPEIFAVETGLSSDAPMNWRISELDARTLVSNSDAHSPGNLGRNANIFNTELSFYGLKSALKTKDPDKCLGTLDMYPEEGKYHMDGHRKCDICLHPSETIEKKNICPVCGKALTIGVLYRVNALADRPEGVMPENRLPFHYIIPLPEMLGEIFNTGSKSKKVCINYQSVLENLGSELDILLNCPLEDIEKTEITLLPEAVRRMRAGEIHISPGYDGEYGKITVFTPEEREKLSGRQSLFKMPGSGGKKKPDKALTKTAKPGEKNSNLILRKPPPAPSSENGILSSLNEEQQKAVTHKGTPVFIIAGPGTGKTRTLTHRAAYLIKERGVFPGNILAVTFTNKAAREMESRIRSLLSSSDNAEEFPMIATFHSLCLNILKEQGKGGYSVIDEEERKALIKEALRQTEKETGPVNLKTDRISDIISTAKQQIIEPKDYPESQDIENSAFFSKIYQVYQNLLSRECIYDYDDLIFNVVKIFESNQEVRELYTSRFQHILVDEYQDLNQGQYRIVRALSPPERELCVIGDPDQSIYGFRGSDLRYFKYFTDDYPNAEKIGLTRNYRSVESILEASHQMIKQRRINSSENRVWSGIHGLKTLGILETATEKAEAVAIGKTIENLMGGTGFHSIDFGKTDETGMDTDLAFSDFAVLYRSNAQAGVIAEILENAGIPCQTADKDQAYRQKGAGELISFLKLTQDAGIFNDFEKIVRSQAPGLGDKALEILKNWYYSIDFPLKDILADFKNFSIPCMSDSMKEKFLSFTEKISDFKARTAGKSVEEKLLFLLENTGIMPLINESVKRKDALNAIINASRGFGDNTSAFLNRIALETDPDTHDINAEKVALMTIHSAKGLEFPVVFIAGCENDYLPFKRSENTAADVEEERRLFYVGMTRARDRLFLTYAKKRTVYGKTAAREISPFVQDIEDRLIRLEKSKGKKIKKESQVQLGLF